MSKGEHQQDPRVTALLQLKNYESPSDEYFERFSLELRDHQRADALKRSSFSLFLERFLAWLDLLGKPKLAYGAVAAYSVLVVVLVIGLRVQREADVKTNPYMQSTPVSARPAQTKVIPVIEVKSVAERERIAAEKLKNSATEDNPSKSVRLRRK